MNLRQDSQSGLSLPAAESRRRGAFIILALVCFVACIGFVILSVDVGYLRLTNIRMQNAVDAAALAAAQEITNAVHQAPEDVENVTTYALAAARQVAADVAQLNGVYVDPELDVEFGQRTMNKDSGKFEINWGATPANVVKVTARRTGDDPEQPDGKLQMFFAGVLGDKYAQMTTDAIAYIESRDLVVVHDFSRSMNYDSFFNTEALTATLSEAQIKANLATAWTDLSALVPHGTLPGQPVYLTLSTSKNGASAEVTFRYDDLTVTSPGTINEVRVTYSNNNQKTFTSASNEVTSKTVNDINTWLVNGSSDIKKVWVKVTPSSSGSSSSSVTMTSNGISATASSDRKSVSISAPNSITKLVIEFTNGTSQTVNVSGSPTSYSYSGSKAIDSIQVYAPANILEWLFGTSTTFNFPSGSGGSGSQSPVELDPVEDTNANVKKKFGLDTIAYPFPVGSWDDLIDYCRTNQQMQNVGWREMYGGMPWIDHLLRSRSAHSQTPHLCKVRHYPFHAIKEGHQLMCTFLDELGFDDHMGMVSYDTDHRVEKKTSDPYKVGVPLVDISSQPITNDYTALNNLMKYKQANFYSQSTNMGGGLKDAVELLASHGRAGARPTILLMTDGNTNAIDKGESSTLPPGWNWNQLFDYNNDGLADYTTNDANKRYVLKQAYNAVNAGYTLHTMAVGADADVSLMKALAHLGNGHFIHVPGGQSVSDMEDTVRAAFLKIASFVPPAKLLADPDVQ